MALAALLAASSVASLAEGIRGEYRAPTEQELAANPTLKDHMILDVTPTQGFGLDNVEQLKSVLGQEKSRADKAEGIATRFKDLPADAATKLARLVELEKIDPNAQADQLANTKFEAARAQLIEQHEAEKAPLKSRADLLFGELDKAKRVQAATAAIVEAGGQPDVLLPHVLGSTKFVEKDGRFDVIVVDDSGNTRIGDASGGNMTLTQLVGEFKGKDAFAPLFAASGVSGGGARPGGGPAPAAGLKKSEMDLNARAQYIEEHGSEAYLSLAG